MAERQGPRRVDGSGTVCFECGCLVAVDQEEAHTTFHGKLQALLEMAAEAHRMADHADAMTRPIGQPAGGSHG